MKFFKNTLSIVALFATGSVCAKAITATTTKGKAPVARAARQQTPTKTTAQAQRGRTKTTQQPIQTGQTYAQLVAFVKNSKDAWNKTEKKLNTQFTDKIAEMALASDLQDYQLDALLQTARDYHAIFTGADDVEILNKLAAERKAIIDWFNIGKENKAKEALGGAL